VSLLENTKVKQMSNWYDAQVDNRNYLSPIGFLFILEKARKVSYLCQSASIPPFTVGSIDIPTGGLARFPVDGNAVYSDLEVQFLVDEDLTNYMQIHNWMRALGTPSEFDERQVWKGVRSRGREDNPLYSDATLQVLNNNNLHNFDVVFKDLFPAELSTLQFNVTMSENDYMIATATFKYSTYEIRKPNSTTKISSDA
jgi:hypothetical protein